MCSLFATAPPAFIMHWSSPNYDEKTMFFSEPIFPLHGNATHIGDDEECFFGFFFDQKDVDNLQICTMVLMT